MVDDVQYIVSSMGNPRSIPGAPALQSLEYYHGVYRIKFGSCPEQIRHYDCQSLILKPLKLGAVKAFLVGELLTAGQKFFQSDESIHQKLKKNKFRDTCGILPQIFMTPQGRNYYWIRGNRYLLTGMIRGREADYRRRSDLRTAIAAMKTFHSFTRNLIADCPDRWAFLRIDLKSTWLKRLREMEICQGMAERVLSHSTRVDGDWRGQYLKDWPEYYAQARELVDALKDLPLVVSGKSGDNESVICYHDWAFHNVIIRGEQGFLIDFDEIIVDHPAHDQANLIGRYLRLNSWSPLSMDRIFSDFQRFYEWRPGDLKRLWMYLSFPYDYWMLGRQYFIEKQPWSMKYYQDQWDRKISRRVQRKRVLEMIKDSI